jgi:FMN phosphatase YigB (HAD superfamily)
MEELMNVYARALDQVERGSIGLLTSDVFDTLVWRDVAEPSDLFLRLGGQLLAAEHLPPHVNATDFRRSRIIAESRARDVCRQQRSTTECTLEEIWAQMPTRWLSPGVDYVAAELDIERATLQVHPAATDLLLAAIGRGVAVVLVSDTYLSPTQLTELLRSVGIPEALLAQVVTSSNERRSKSDGLLQSVVDSSGKQRSQVLHIGDNPHADIETGHRLGINVAAVLAPRDVVRAAVPKVSDVGRCSQIGGSDGGFGALRRQTLLNAGALGSNPSYQFGAAVAGPLVAGFVGWAADTARTFTSAPTYCLLREGGFIADLMQVLRPEHPTQLVHASRWAYSRAAVVSGSVDELDQALARRAMLTHTHVAQAFDLDPGRVAAVIGRDPIHHVQRPEALRAIAADDELLASIVQSSARVRAPVARYLRTVMRFDEPLVLCDIGWGGTIQVALSRILEAEGIEVPLIGLYLMLSTTGMDRVAAGHQLYGYVPREVVGADDDVTTALARNVELLERVTTPAVGTLLGFDDAGTPLTAQDEGHPQSLERAQQGVRDFVRSLAGARRHPAWTESLALRTALAAEVSAAVLAPSQAFALEVGGWSHDDVAGAESATLIDADGDLPSRYLNIGDSQLVDFSDVFWPAGRLAASDPTLAAQLGAVADGVDPGLFCSPSALGDAYLAAFAADSPLAVTVQHAQPPLTNSQGWAALRIRASTPTIRELQVSFGTMPGLVEVGALRVEVDGAASWRVTDLASLGSRAHLHRARWIAPGLLAVDEGGCLIVYPPAAVRASGGTLRAAVAFRAWPLEGPARRLAKEGSVRRLRRLASRLLVRVKYR